MASVLSLGVIDIPDASLAERIAYVGWSEGSPQPQNLEGSTRVPLGVYYADPDRHCPWCIVVEQVLQTPEGEEAVNWGRTSFRVRGVCWYRGVHTSKRLRYVGPCSILLAIRGSGISHMIATIT